MKAALAGLVLIGALALPPGAQAHHSFAMFDNAKTMNITGVIKEFQWTNPHSWIQIMVTNAAGVVEEWGIEGGSPNGLARQGWRKTSLKAGDKAVVKIHPLKNGEKGGSLMTVTLADGRVLGEGPIVTPPPGAKD